MKYGLSEVVIRRAKARDKGYKLTDGGGLYLFVTAAGGKLWRMDYRFCGRRKTLSLGRYPVVTLAQARDRALDAKRLLADGVDPSAAKRQRDGDALTFAQVALAWHTEKRPAWSEKHADRLLRRMEVDLFPFIGALPIAQVGANEVEQVLKRVALRALDSAHRLKSALRGTFDFAIRKGYCSDNPVPAMKGVLPPNRHRHMPAPTDPVEIGRLLRAIDAFSGSFVVHCALRLAPLVFVRPGELRQMEWCEVDFERRLWTIPAQKMKMRAEHLVPLSTQALAILEQIFPLSGHGRFVFPGRARPDRPMSDAAINNALRSLGFTRDEITGHGFRAMARTLLDEVLRFNPDAIEAQLAHRVPDRLGRAYNRTRHLDERVRMMQDWADWLERVKT